MNSAWFRFVFGSNGRVAVVAVYRSTNDGGEFGLSLMGVPDPDDEALVSSAFRNWLGGSNTSYLVHFDANCESDTIDKFLLAFRDFLSHPAT